MSTTLKKIREQEAKPKSPAAFEGGRMIGEELQKLITQFGWRVDANELSHATAEHFDEVSTWLDNPDARTPLTVWHLISIPNDQWMRLWKNIADAKAIAWMLLRDRAWFGAITDPVSKLIELAEINAGKPCKTLFGTVFVGTKPELQIWFGSKTPGKIPAIAGDQAKLALQILFGRSPEETPEPKTENRKPKTAQPDAAKPDAATLSNGAPISLDLIDPDPENDRKTFDPAVITDLANSIDSLGLLQPILVTPVGTRFRIVAGEQRWRACRQLKRQEILARIVTGTALDLDLARLAENSERQDLSPIEKAGALKRMMEKHSLTQSQLATRSGVTQGQISSSLGLLKLPASIQSLIGDGENQISPTTIRPLLPYHDLPAVMAGFESAVEDTAGPLTPDFIDDTKDRLLRENSRSMKYEATMSSWSKPQQKQRHFKSVSPENWTTLDVRTIDGEERAFNVPLFHKLNKEPFAERLKKFNADKKKAASPAGKASEKKQLILPHKDWMLQQYIAAHFGKQIAAKLGDKKADVTQAVLVLAIAGSLTNQLPSRHTNHAKYCAALTELSSDSKTMAAKLQPLAAKQMANHHHTSEFCQYLASLLQLDLISSWKPNAEFLACLTPAGLQLCAAELELEFAADLDEKKLRTALLKQWIPGVIPRFLLPFFHLPKPAKKAKAA